MKLKKILTTMLTFLPIWNLEGKNNSSDYKPFGQEANATGTEKYAFTGQYSEAEIGLYYFGARWYDASLGRFISEDPIKGSMLSSQSQNPYVYCMNNPLRFIDPTGMMGDIPDWSLPDNYFDGYVNSVGSLINTVVNTATEFAAGVNHGVAAGTTSASGSAGVPNPGTTYSPSNELGYGSGGGQGYWDNGDINLPTPTHVYENHFTFSYGFGKTEVNILQEPGNRHLALELISSSGVAIPGVGLQGKESNYFNLSEYKEATRNKDIPGSKTVGGGIVGFHISTTSNPLTGEFDQPIDISISPIPGGGRPFISAEAVRNGPRIWIDRNTFDVFFGLFE